MADRSDIPAGRWEHATACAKCGHAIAGPRVVFSTEATDERGVDVLVAKRWIVCRDCADEVFDRIGEPSPWSDEDFKTLVLPDDAVVGQHMGGFGGGLAGGLGGMRR